MHLLLPQMDQSIFKAMMRTFESPIALSTMPIRVIIKYYIYGLKFFSF